MQNVQSNKSCMDSNSSDTSECMFSDNVIKHITTDLFIRQPIYDSWQIGNIIKENN